MKYIDFLDNGVRLSKKTYLGKLSANGKNENLSEIKKYKSEQLMRKIGEDLIVKMLKENKEFLIRTTTTGWYNTKYLGRKIDELKIDVHLSPLNEKVKRKFIEMFETEINNTKPPKEFDFDGSMNTSSTVRFLNMVFEQNITQLPPDDDIKFVNKILCSDGIVRTNFENGNLYYQVEKDYFRHYEQEEK